MAAGYVEIRDVKRALRERLLRLRSGFSAEENEASSDAIWTLVRELPVWRAARTIHTYVGALPGEVRTDPLITWSLEHGRTVIVPVVEPGNRDLRHLRLRSLADLRPTRWGGLEPTEGVPADPNAADLVIVPGVAFDRAGHRLGIGGGYYDRFLAAVRAPKVALAHSFQIVDSVPFGQDDVAVDVIVTPDQVIVPAAGAIPR